MDASPDKRILDGDELPSDLRKSVVKVLPNIAPEPCYLFLLSPCESGAFDLVYSASDPVFVCHEAECLKHGLSIVSDQVRLEYVVPLRAASLID